MKKTIQDYIERGHKVIDKALWKEYDKIVPIRVKDLYCGMELGAFLEIVESYNEKKDLKECYRLFDKQGHSGMSASLVASLIYKFHKNGDIIVRALGFTCKDKENEKNE